MTRLATPGGGRAGPAVGLLAGLAALVVVAHAPYLARTLEDIDSVNFALGIRDYDPTRHRPHPPGYPVYIALGKLVTAALPAPSAGSVPAQPEARALAWVSLAAAAAAVPLLYLLFSHLEARGAAGGAPVGVLNARALAATVLTVTCPLFWYMTARPMSDLPGLAAALAAQGLLLGAWSRHRAPPQEGRLLAPDALAVSTRLIVLGAFMAGAAVGLRSQVAWLTLPLLALVLADRIGRGPVAIAALGALAAFGAGVAAWAVPMVAASGGPGAYLAALGSQGGEDLAGVEMLAQRPSRRLLLLAALRSFVFPWDSVFLAAPVLVLAVAGAAALAMTDRRALLAVGILAMPYGAFHLLFHDTAFVRYALPLVPVVAYLAVCGAERLLGRAALASTSVLTIWGLTIAQPALTAYGGAGSPVMQAFAAMAAEATRAAPGALAGHHPFKRLLEVEPPAYAAQLPIEPRREWLEIVRYWRDGGEAPLWFLADPRRTDLALIAGEALADRTAFAWGARGLSGFGGMRPADVVWHRIRRPAWMLAEGWALTPETAGAARLAGRGPHLGPIAGYVARRSAPTVLMIGGRHLGRAGDPEVRFTLAIDGRLVEEWTAGPGFFLRFVDLPAEALAGPGPFATVTVRSEAVRDGTVPTAVEQFDVQPAGALIWGYGDGWHEAEADPVRGELWRWTSDRAVLEVRGEARDRTLVLAGASPLASFDAPPTVVVRAGPRELARFAPAAAFREVVPVPGHALAAAGGRLAIETDRVFVPADRGENLDRRRLGLRILGVRIE